MTNHYENIKAQIKDMTADERKAFFAQREADRVAKENAEKVQRMRDVKDALFGTGSNGFSLRWPSGVYSEVKFSTEMLEADVLAGGTGVMTHPRQAEPLLRLDTVARRRRAEAEAHTLGNLQGGTHGQNVSRAVSALLSMIEKGTEDEEMWAERVARQAREREAEMRKTHPGAIYYPPEMRKN